VSAVRTLVAVAVAVAGLFAIVACDDEADATPTITSVPSPTHAETGTPNAETVVVADLTTLTSPSGFSARRARIVLIETGTGAELSSFELAGRVRVPWPLALHSEEIHAVSERSFDAYSLEGTHLRTMVEVPEGRLLLGASLSGDGRHLAYIHTTVDELSVETIADTHLVILSMESGETVLELSQTDERLADGFYGQIWSVWWAAGDGYVVVDPVTHSDSPSPYAAISLDGTVVVPTRGEAKQVGTEVDPAGRAAVVGFYYLGSGECFGAIDKEGNLVSFPLRWVDLRTGDTLAETQVPQPPYEAVWAPDASAMLFARIDCEPDAENGARAWFQWAPGMAAPERVNDPIQLWRGWYGDRAVLGQDAGGMLYLPSVDATGYMLSSRTLSASLVVGDSAPISSGGEGQRLLLGFVD